ncbi:hypothetical protein P4C99_03190 [Pontiellaceae bacterium B1224]|nr:hypothetical protein [Pontiellaceae bacterium B1224]
MKQKNTPFRPNAMLWWVAIFALILSGALYYFLGTQAEIDVSIRQARMAILLIGIVIAGVCLIAGTASRWFYPK